MKIKYKAWDKIQKRMWYNVQEADNGMYTHCCEGKKTCHCTMDDDFGEDFLHRNFCDVLADTNLILLQYTGLKDKKRVEIYNGDIIIAVGYTGEVKFVKGKFIVYAKGHPHTDLEDFITCQQKNVGEVIGNKYEKIN